MERSRQLGILSQFDEDKLMKSVLSNDKKTIDDGKLIAESINQGISAFTPDLAFENITKNFTIAKQLYGEKLIRLLAGYNPNYIAKNLGIPEFQKELDMCIKIPVDEAPGENLDEILRLIAANPHIYMVTGHTSVDEGVRLVELAEEYGIKKTIVSSAVTKEASVDQLKYMADKGAFIEYTLAAFTHTTTIPKTHYYVEREYASIDEGMSGEVSGGVKLVAEQIDELGAEHCIICTDFGVYTLPTPVEGLREFIACLLDLGIAPDDVSKMVKSNPEKLLGLN